MTNTEDAMIHSSSRLASAQRVLKYATDRTRPELLGWAREVVRQGKVEFYTGLVAAMPAAELLAAHEATTRQLAGADLGTELWEASRGMLRVTKAELLKRLA